MAYATITDATLTQDKALTQSTLRQFRDNDEYCKGTLDALIVSSNLVLNGSFEADTNADGIPDNWTRTLYSSGAGAYETSDYVWGSKSYKLTHPGGAAPVGGGYLESDYIPISFLSGVIPPLAYKASAAGIKVEIVAKFYNAAKVSIEDRILYTCTSNPTQWVALSFADPWMVYGAEYVKLQLIGGKNDTNVAGYVLFDAVGLTPVIARWRTAEAIALASTTDTGSSFGDVGTGYSITVPASPAGLTLNVTMDVLNSGSGGTVSGRFRIGTNYSTTLNTSGITTLDVTSLTGAQTLQFQAAETSGQVTIASPADYQKFYTKTGVPLIRKKRVVSSAGLWTDTDY